MDLLVCDAVITRWIFQDYKACPGDALPSRSFWKMCFAFLSWVHSAPNLYKQFQCAWPQKVEPSVHSAVAFDPLMSALPLRRRGASCQLCTCEVNRFRNVIFSRQMVVTWVFFFWLGGSWIRPVPGLFLGSETEVLRPAHLKLQNHGIFVSFSARTILSIWGSWLMGTPFLGNFWSDTVGWFRNPAFTSWGWKFYKVFYNIPGGWEWDFWTINSISFETFKLGFLEFIVNREPTESTH